MSELTTLRRRGVNGHKKEKLNGKMGRGAKKYCAPDLLTSKERGRRLNLG